MTIHRVEQQEAGLFGYYAVVTVRGVESARFFDDRSGGKRAALKRAKQFQQRADTINLNLKTGFKTKRNNSGHRGVCRMEYKKHGRVYAYWQAFYSVEGKQKKARFSILQYGEDLAKDLAIRQREIWEETASK